MNLQDLRSELQPRHLLSSLTIALVTVISGASVQISLAALIFSGALSTFLPNGIGLLLFGGFIMMIVVALTSSLQDAIAVPQDTPAAILALVAAAIVARLSTASPQALFATVVAAIMITSLLAGLLFLILGRFKLSGFVRFIPYPVIGGFLAGTGWLLAKGALGVMLGTTMTLAILPGMFQLGNLMRWLPGVIFAITLLLVLRRNNHFLVTPLMLALGIGLFYLTLTLAHISIPQAEARGWLLGPFPAGGLWQPLSPASFAMIDWPSIFGQLDKVGAILVLSVISLLLNSSALEVTVKQDIDLNRELESAGWANLLAGLFGSSVGYQALSLSSLQYRMGGKGRLAGVLAGLLCGAAALFGASLLSFFPKIVLGGFLFFLGLTFLAEWVVDAYKRLPRADYVLVLVILAVIASIGFLQGIGLGILVAAVLFVVSYSRINVVRQVLNGSTFHSKVERPKTHRELIQKKGGEIYILRLQGFLFFGTAQGLLDHVRLRLADAQLPRPRFLVLDFARVARIDSSAVFSITRLKQLTLSQNISMVWTEVAPQIRTQLERGGLIDESDDSFIILPTLDHGLEWCENQLLKIEGHTDLTGFIEKLERQLKRVFPNAQSVERLMHYLERKDVNTGFYLFRQGDPPQEMYFIESGLLSVQLELPDGKLIRLRSMRGGTTIGEMGLYLDEVRTASVVTERPSTLYRLSREALKEMEGQDAEVATLLHRWIGRLLAERLADNTRLIEALMD